jgi:hypothetical protein
LRGFWFVPEAGLAHLRFDGGGALLAGVKVKESLVVE